MVKVKIIPPILLFFLLPVFAAAQNFGGNAPAVKWMQVKSPSAKIIFPAGLDSQAVRMANMVQLLDSNTSATIGGKQRRWNIILQNQTTVPNAYVRMAPIMSELYMTAPQDNFNTGSIRWDDNLIIHEQRHMQQFSNFNKGITKLFTFLLGQEGQLLADGIFVPDYFFEGDAVFQETLVSQQGRGRMPSFLNDYKSLWLGNKKYSWMKYRSGSYKDLVPDHYQTGYILVAYGYEKYGADFWKKVTNDAVQFKGLFNKAIERYSGVPFKTFRTDAINYFRDRATFFPVPGAKDNEFSAYQHITPTEKRNVTDYLFPAYISDDSIVVTKKSYKEVSSFYLIVNGKEEKLRVKNFTLDDYYSYRNGKIVYASFQSDPRWANRDYSVIQLLDIRTRQQKQLTFKSKYFSPDINEAGNEIIAVSVNANGTNNLCKIDAGTGALLQQLPNPANYFFTQTKYINAGTAISAVRNPAGQMALLKVDLSNGITEQLTPFSYNVLGYPVVKNDTVYYSMMYKNRDRIFALSLNDKKIFMVVNSLNGVYHPAVNSKGGLLFSENMAGGVCLSVSANNKRGWTAVYDTNTAASEGFETVTGALSKPGSNILNQVAAVPYPVSRYKKSFHLFNFHSRRPVFDDPEYGYTFYSDNVLSSFSNTLTYTYNRNDKSHTIGFNGVYGGWLPLISAGVEESFNRTIDTAAGRPPLIFNTATVKAGFSVPLSFIGGRTNQFLNFGAGYNIEQYAYRGVTKNVFTNKAVEYASSFLSFSNVSRKAKQHVNPRWAQTISFNYRDAFTYSASHKLIANASLYFPGLSVNHSLMLDAAFQKRDSLPDLFSNIFSYARGYQALSTRKMYKLGVNYQLPLCYPDWGVGGILYFQRIRANAFYDYNNATARISGVLTNIVNRSTGAEVYFDTKVWNSLPVSIGVRYAHLLDTDLIYPTVKNKWEIIIPIDLIPN
jgi:hypothetical protein